MTTGKEILKDAQTMSTADFMNKHLSDERLTVLDVDSLFDYNEGNVNIKFEGELDFVSQASTTPERIFNSINN